MNWPSNLCQRITWILELSFMGMDWMNCKKKRRRKLTHFALCSLLIYISRSFYLNSKDRNNQAGCELEIPQGAGNNVSFSLGSNCSGTKFARIIVPFSSSVAYEMRDTNLWRSWPGSTCRCGQDMATHCPAPATLILKPTLHLRCRCSSSHLHTSRTLFCYLNWAWPIHVLQYKS